jgi:hypothetical protein
MERGAQIVRLLLSQTHESVTVLLVNTERPPLNLLLFASAHQTISMDYDIQNFNTANTSHTTQNPYELTFSYPCSKCVMLIANCSQVFQY